MSTVHLFIMSRATGEPSVFLVEREAGTVEFPTLVTDDTEEQDEARIVDQIRACTGLTVSISGYVDPPAGALICPPGSRFLLAQRLSGHPEIREPHVGWEWRPAAMLLSLHFVPKLMVDELRSYMNG